MPGGILAALSKWCHWQKSAYLYWWVHLKRLAQGRCAVLMQFCITHDTSMAPTVIWQWAVNQSSGSCVVHFPPLGHRKCSWAPVQFWSGVNISFHFIPSNKHSNCSHATTEVEHSISFHYIIPPINQIFLFLLVSLTCMWSACRLFACPPPTNVPIEWSTNTRGQRQ